MEIENYQSVLRKVGTVLIVVGVLDILWMIWSIVNQTSYSSSFNIFAVIAGIFLVRGGLRTAKYVRQFMAFMLSGFIGLVILVPLVFPLVFPLDFWLITFRLYPVSFLGFVLLFLIDLGLVCWIFRALGADSVKQAQIERGITVKPPYLPLTLGGLLIMFVFTFMFLSFRGETAEESIRRAEQQYGTEYKYVIKNLNLSESQAGKTVSAVLYAYNVNEIKTVKVEWKE